MLSTVCSNIRKDTDLTSNIYTSLEERKKAKKKPSLLLISHFIPEDAIFWLCLFYLWTVWLSSIHIWRTLLENRKVCLTERWEGPLSPDFKHSLGRFSKSVKTFRRQFFEKNSCRATWVSFIPFTQHYLHNVTVSVRGFEGCCFPFPSFPHQEREASCLSCSLAGLGWEELGEWESSVMQADSKDSVCILVLVCDFHTTCFSTRDMTSWILVLGWPNRPIIVSLKNIPTKKWWETALERTLVHRWRLLAIAVQSWGP